MPRADFGPISGKDGLAIGFGAIAPQMSGRNALAGCDHRSGRGREEHELANSVGPQLYQACSRLPDSLFAVASGIHGHGVEGQRA
jgi:hypothetical protein